MRIFSKVMSLFLATTFLMACSKGDKSPVERFPQTPSPSAEKLPPPNPEEEMPSVTGFQPLTQAPQPKSSSIETLKTAIERTFGINKSEADQFFSPEAKSQVLVLEENLEMKTVQRVNCRGRVRNLIRPVKPFSRVLDLKPPQTLAVALAGKVRLIEVENQKTNALLQVEVLKDETDLAKALEQNLPSSWSGRGVSLGSSSGVLKVVISDNILFRSTELAVGEGKNALQVRYKGPCAERDASEKCVKAEILGSQDLTLDLRLKKHLGGVVEQKMELEKNCSEQPAR